MCMAYSNGMDVFFSQEEEEKQVQPPKCWSIGGIS